MDPGPGCCGSRPFCCIGIPEAVQAAEPKTALEGIYVENISVGGMTEEEITQAVNAKVEELKNSTIQLNAGNQSIQVTAGDLGLTYTNTDIACQALFAGQRGNVLERFRVQRHLEETGPEVLELQFSVDAEAVRSVIENQAAAMNTEAVDASLTLEDGSFVVHEGQDGYVINADASVEKVVNYMSEEWHGGTAALCWLPMWMRRRATRNSLPWFMILWEAAVPTIPAAIPTGNRTSGEERN